jgi:hypothetical protein
MKRVLTILAIMLLPLSLWAMTPVNDSDLSNVTGQAGVNINANLTMNISIGTMAWGDADGVSNTFGGLWTTTANAGGYIGVNDFNIKNLTIKARTAASDGYNGYNTLYLKPITIDVATGTKLGVANTTFVRFGLGALQINLDSLTFDVSLGTRPATFGDNVVLDQNLGVVTLGAMAIYINPWSYVDIYSHGGPTGSGVNFDIAVTLDRVALPYMSWGDKDGLGTGVTTSTGTVVWMSNAANPGYIGLADFQIGDATHAAVTITGSVAIDIATVTSGIYLQDSMGGAGASSVTVVHISFPSDFTVDVAKMVGRVIVASNGNLNYTGSTYTPALNTELGDIYIQGLNLKIHENSWVDIWAH